MLAALDRVAGQRAELEGTGAEAVAAVVEVDARGLADPDGGVDGGEGDVVVADLGALGHRQHPREVGAAVVVGVDPDFPRRERPRPRGVRAVDGGRWTDEGLVDRWEVSAVSTCPRIEEKEREEEARGMHSCGAKKRGMEMLRLHISVQRHFRALEKRFVLQTFSWKDREQSNSVHRPWLFPMPCRRSNQ